MALVATLRSGLFGISDVDLYAFKRAGGRFSYHAAIPPGLKDSTTAEFQDAFDRLKKYALWLSKLPPVAAIEKVLANVGLAVLACTSPGGTIQAGSLAKGIELLRKQQTGGWTAANLVEYLGQIIELEEKHDGMPARPHEAPTVRIMNLHKVKGLEAPIVFLADPSGESDHDVDLHIDRSGNLVRGYLAIYGEKQGWQQPPLLAHPKGWEDLAEEEQKFRAAENQRLLYVAATRAGTMLTITEREKGNNWNPWKFFEQWLKDSPQLDSPDQYIAKSVRPINLTYRDVRDSVQEIQQRWDAVARPTYATAAAKEISLSGVKPALSKGEHGTEWGSVIHILLETAMRSPEANLQRLAATALTEYGLVPSLLDTVVQTVQNVMNSPIWQRAAASKHRLVEVPFESLLPAESAPAGLPTILRGVIDLAFLEPQGWVIVDYKTDRATPEVIGGLTEHYSPQLNTYASVWQSITGQKVHEKGLYFTCQSRYVQV